MEISSFIKDDALKLLKHPDLKALKKLKAYLDCDDYFAAIGMLIERKLKKPVSEKDKRLYLAYYFKCNEYHYYKFVIQLTNPSPDGESLFSLGLQRTDGWVLTSGDENIFKKITKGINYTIENNRKTFFLNTVSKCQLKQILDCCFNEKKVQKINDENSEKFITLEKAKEMNRSWLITFLISLFKLKI